MYRVRSIISRGRQLGSSLPKWAVGIAIITPTAAAIQGAYLLQDFRDNHLNAPMPVSPSRGIVLMKSKRTKNYSIPRTIKGGSQVNSSMEKEDRPLRLLVIGDSLAAGVGVMKQSTPILPESIAKALSEASGRAVSWTCVGTPGASSSQVVKDILSFKESSNSGLLERKLVEFKAKKERAKDWLLHRSVEGNGNNDEKESRRRRIAAKVERIKKRWSIIRKDIESFHQNIIRKTDAETMTATPMEQINPTPDFNKIETEPNDYDIAVVLTGLNDLKEVWLPWMMNETLTKSTNGIKGELLRVLHALEKKMKLDFSIKTNENDENFKAEEDGDYLAKVTSVNDSYLRKDSHRRGPIVVFPAMPANPTHPLIYIQPLSWFVVPLLNAVDNHKKQLAEKFPNAVLYVDSPSTSSMEDMEAGRGPIFAKRKAEKVLLSLTDVTKKAKENVEKLMKQHYERWTNDLEVDSATGDKASPKSSDHQNEATESGIGATLLSIDNVHPNDEGYDFWGRHIAAAIVADWEKQSEAL